jgi:hypothetical protein
MENIQSGLEIASPMPASDSITITVVGDQNMAPPAAWSLPTSSVCSFTVADDSSVPSAPLNEGAVRVGNSLLSSFVPEGAILRDKSEDF